jgi:hypothetical protein
LVVPVGSASGSREVAAALACAGSDADRAGLLIDLGVDGAPRPTPVATDAARSLEARLRSHISDVSVAARGRTCHLRVAGAAEGGPEVLEAVRAALPLARGGACAVSISPHLLEPALDQVGVAAPAVLLRVDLLRDRALTALAVRGLLGRGARVAVAKRPLPWAPARLSLFGALGPGSAGGLPPRVLERCLG